MFFIKNVKICTHSDDFDVEKYIVYALFQDLVKWAYERENENVVSTLTAIHPKRNISRGDSLDVAGNG